MTSLKTLLANATPEPDGFVNQYALDDLADMMIKAAPLVLELMDAVRDYRDVSGNHYVDYDKMTDAHDALCKALGVESE